MSVADPAAEELDGLEIFTPALEGEIGGSQLAIDEEVPEVARIVMPESDPEIVGGSGSAGIDGEGADRFHPFLGLNLRTDGTVVALIDPYFTGVRSFRHLERQLRAVHEDTGETAFRIGCRLYLEVDERGLLGRIPSDASGQARFLL